MPVAADLPAERGGAQGDHVEGEQVDGTQLNAEVEVIEISSDSEQDAPPPRHPARVEEDSVISLTSESESDEPSRPPAKRALKQERRSMSVVLVSDSEVQSNSSNKENVAPDGGEVSAAGPGYSVKNGVCVAEDGTMSLQRMIVRGPFVVPIEGPPEREEVKSEVDTGSDDDAMDVKSEEASELAPSDDSSLSRC